MDQFKCLFCDTKVSNLLDIANHVVYQHPKNSLKYFEKRFCHSTGKETYTPVQYGLTCDYIKQKVKDGYTLKVTKNGKLFFQSAVEESHYDISCDEFVNKINGYLKNMFMVLRDRGRVEDFISVMQSLSNGALPPSNISLNLLLDVGRFLGQETVNSMRYTEGNVLTL